MLSNPSLRALPNGMDAYLVLFEDWRGAGTSRYERTRSQIDLVEHNVERLRGYIHQNDLGDQIASIANGTTIGAVGVIATVEGARRLGAMDGVVKVIRAR